jgi:biopolymer transport protein ExbB/biopolymer transport protein TolQ
VIDRLLQVALVGSTWVLYLLAFLSVVSIGAMLERWLFFRRHSDDADALKARLSASLLAGEPAEARDVLTRSPSIEARVLDRAWVWWHGGAAAFEDAFESELASAQKELERGSGLLGTLGNNAPFIGLFGTVLGVIEAFHELSAGASKAAMGNVMSGIAEALVATGVGLFVALPAVVAYNVIQKRIGGIESSARSLSKLVTAYLKTPEREGRSLEGAKAKPSAVAS